MDVIDGFGSFVDRNTVKVETKDGDIEILGEKIFINTGAKTSFPKLEGIKDNFQGLYMLDKELGARPQVSTSAVDEE